MKTVFTNQELAHVWANQSQAEGRNANKSMFFEGASIYSYGYHFKIAQFIRPGLVLFTNNGYSITTSKHKYDVQRAIPSKVRVHCVAYPDVTRHADNVKSYIEDIQGDYAKAKRARGYFDYHLKHAADLRKALCEYVKDFSKEIRKSFKGPERKTLQMLLDLKWMPFPAKEIKERTAKARAFRKKSQEVRSTLLKAQIEAAKKDDDDDLQEVM